MSPFRLARLNLRYCSGSTAVTTFVGGQIDDCGLTAQLHQIIAIHPGDPFRLQIVGAFTRTAADGLLAERVSVNLH